MIRSKGDLNFVLEHVAVKRLILSESDRIGIGTFQPKDEKNQDSTELSGDINFRKIAVYGSDSDPRAFNFDGEFNIANRGILEFVEVLKLDTAFLYDLLGATQEHRIKPKKFAQTDIDEVVLGHTNEPEYKKLVSDDKMEALRDRILKIDIPYLTKLDHEERIYENLFRRAAHRIAPHTIHVAAMWAILTRLEEPNDQKLNLMQKLKIYNGEVVPSVSDPSAAAERARELKSSAPKEGMSGVSPRYVIDTISTVLASAAGETITPLQLMAAIHDKLKNNAMIKDEKVITRYRRLLDEVKKDYEDTIKLEVRDAVIRSDETGLKTLASNYIQSVRRHVEILETGAPDPQAIPDGRLMANIEAKMGVHPSQADDVRRTLVNTVRMREIQGKPFDLYDNPQLRQALEDKLFEDRKDSLKLSGMNGVLDETTARIIAYLGYRFGHTESSAREIVQYVSDIYARGEARKK
jgi:serine protein kinase